MPNNVCNILVLREQSDKAIKKRIDKTETKMSQVCTDLKSGVVRKRGFSRLSKLLGALQGRLWQGNSKMIAPARSSFEGLSKKGVRIHKDCTECNLCVGICPVNNLINEQGIITPQGNCIVCYRCVNRCPKRAITVMRLKTRPKWQYKGIGGIK